MRTTALAMTVFLVATGVFAETAEQQELQLADKVQQLRNAFRGTLEDLTDYYAQSGQNLKMEKTRQELNHLLEFAPFDYVTLIDHPSDVAGKKRYIQEAEILFQDGQMYKDYPDLFNKRQRLLIAIARLNRLLDMYPDSERVDDALFMLAEIRNGFYFEEWETALQLYEKCLEANPETTYPVRFRAGEILLKKKQDYEQAAECFRWTVNHSPDKELRAKAGDYLNNMRQAGHLK